MATHSGVYRKKLNQPKIVRNAQNRARERVYANVDPYTVKRAIDIEEGRKPKGPSGSFRKLMISQ